MSSSIPAPKTPEEFRRAVVQVEKSMAAFIGNRGTPRLKELWPDWQKRLGALSEQSEQQPDVSISMVGGTGAGKSTLLNALIGARVLPVSNMRACTAAISQVSWAEGEYRAQVEFISRESWQKEIDALHDDLRYARLSFEQHDSSDIGNAISRAALDKLWTVYKKSDNQPREQFDPFDLQETSEITYLLDQGRTSFNRNNLDDFRKGISKYLDSKHRFWPIVKSVKIQGPFEALRDGVTLVDLPGVNDPNEAREEVTRKHLKTCRFVWIVFNIKRALTRDTMNLMQSDDFLRQIVMDGRADALTFVGTAADDIDRETAVDEFDADEDADTASLIQMRNHAVQKVIMDQLDDLAAQLARLGREDASVAAKLAGKLKSSKILTVSAVEYLRLKGLSKKETAVLHDVSQTQIPMLQAHMSQICQGYGTEALVRSLTGQLKMLLAEAKRETQAQQAIIRNQEEVTDKQRKELGEAVQSAEEFLKRDLTESKSRLKQDLEAGQSLIAERIKRAVERAKMELESTTLKKWQRTHHSTLRAVCRRGGSHKGTSGKNDFPEDLCKPILDGIAFAWSEFFGEKLRSVLEKWTDQLRRNKLAFQDRLLKSVDDMETIPPSVVESITGIFETTENILNELLSQTSNEMDGRVTEKQRTLYETIPEQVRAHMLPAFELGATQSGSGMKDRIVSILAEHAQKVSLTMFDDAREKLMAGVRSLNSWIEQQYEGMAEAVTRNSKMAGVNLSVGGVKLTAEAIALQKAILLEFDELMEQIVRSTLVA